MILRPARHKDSAVFYQLRNLPEVRALSGQTEEIEPDDHYLWWYDVREWRYIIGTNQGYLRVALDGTVSLAVDPEARGRGLGTKALRELPRILNKRPLTAVVDYTNLPSQIAFGRAGWRPTRFEMR